MWGANLSRVKLRETNLSRAKLWKANLSQARFEPLHGTLPPAIALLGLRGLDSLTFKGSSSFGLMDLREIFKKAGMREEERQVTYALNRNRRINTWEEIKEKATDKGKKKTEEEKGEEKEITWATLGIAWLENTFQLVFFEWTCDYGMTPSKPLDIMFFFIPVFVLPYLLAFGSRDTKTGIWVLLLPDRVLERELKGRPFKLTTHRPSTWEPGSPVSKSVSTPFGPLAGPGQWPASSPL